MKKRAFVAALLALGAFVPAVLATGQQWGPWSSTANYVVLYENEIGSTVDRNDFLSIYAVPPTGTPLIILAEIPHTGPGYCYSSGIHPDTWNNCVSSFKVVFRDSTRHLCLYDSANGDLGIGQYERVTPANGGYRQNTRTYGMGDMGTDQLGELKWVSLSQPCQP